MTNKEFEPESTKIVRICFTRNMGIIEMLDRHDALRESLASAKDGEKIKIDLLPLFEKKKFVPEYVEEEQTIKQRGSGKEKTITVQHKIGEWSLEQDEDGEILRMKLRMPSGEELVVRRAQKIDPTEKWLLELLKQDWVLET